MTCEFAAERRQGQWNVRETELCEVEGWQIWVCSVFFADYRIRGCFGGAARPCQTLLVVWRRRSLAGYLLGMTVWIRGGFEWVLNKGVRCEVTQNRLFLFSHRRVRAWLAQLRRQAETAEHRQTLQAQAGRGWSSGRLTADGLLK